MGIFNKIKQSKQLPTLDGVVEKKLSLFVTIVNDGLAESVIKVFEHVGASAQFVQKGNGTAQKEIRDILGIEDNGKEVVLSFIDQDSIKDAKNELVAIFMTSKKGSGIGFAIPLTSIIGVRVYQFLADTIKEAK